MADIPKYRRLSDGRLAVAVQYKTQGVPVGEAITRIRNFVVGVDVDTRVTVANEQMLDTVRPILQTWNLKEGRADIEVDDHRSKITFRMALGDWLVRIDDFTTHVTEAAFKRDFAEVDEFDELANLIYANFPWEGETYQAVAERVAATLINAGWIRKV